MFIADAIHTHAATLFLAQFDFYCINRFIRLFLDEFEFEVDFFIQTMRTCERNESAVCVLNFNFRRHFSQPIFLCIDSNTHLNRARMSYKWGGTSTLLPSIFLLFFFSFGFLFFVFSLTTTRSQFWMCFVCLPNSSNLISLAAWIPSSLRFRSIKRLRAAAARSSADCAQPIVRIASTQNVLKTYLISAVISAEHKCQMEKK